MTLKAAGQMLQQVMVIYFDTLEKANRFVNSIEEGLFEDHFRDLTKMVCRRESQL